MKALTPEQVAAYRYDGFLFPIPALTPEEVATCLAGLDRLERELGSLVAEADIKWRSHAYAHSFTLSAWMAPAFGWLLMRLAGGAGSDVAS